MRKVTFTRTVTPANRSGKTFAQGKTYWLHEDSVRYWIGEDAVVIAADDAVAENEPPPPLLRPETVTLRRARGGRYHVFGPDNYRFSEQPLSAHDAERLRQAVLDGKVAMRMPSGPAVAPAEQPSFDPSSIKVGDVAIRQDKDEGGIRLYVLHDWPEAIEIAKEFLAAPPVDGSLRIEDGLVKITAENGAASYRPLGETAHSAFFAFVAGTFAAPPERIAADPA